MILFLILKPAILIVFFYLTSTGKISLYDVEKINVHYDAKRLGHPDQVTTTSNNVPDHYNYCNIVALK